jgi:hypothetical protein
MTTIRFRLVNQWTLEQTCPSNSPNRDLGLGMATGTSPAIQLGM